MKHALALEKDPANDNAVSALLATLGDLVTPVFRAREALLAAQLMHFDLLIIHTTTIPEDRCSLADERKRCFRLAIRVLSNDPECEACPNAGFDCDSVDAVCNGSRQRMHCKWLLQLGAARSLLAHGVRPTPQ